eukprot:c57376_g1_i1 orf=47-202(+)
MLWKHDHNPVLYSPPGTVSGSVLLCNLHPVAVFSSAIVCCSKIRWRCCHLN